MENVRVLYCIPNHNGGRYLAELLQSIELDAQAGDFAAEILLLNDGCTDDSEEIAAEYTRAGALPLHTITRCRADGEGAARSFLLQNAHTLDHVDFLRSVDADDLLPPGSTAAMIDLARSKSLGAVSGQFDLFGDETGVQEQLPLEHDEIMANMRRTNSFRTACALFDARQARAHRLNVGPEWKISADYALLLNLIRYARLGNLPGTVLHYRKHPESVSGKNLKRVSAAFLRIVARNWGNPALPSPSVADLVALSRIAAIVVTPRPVLAAAVAAKRRLRAILRRTRRSNDASAPFGTS